jgi:hypothetical protein
MTWISTFAIHRGADLDRALDNARRFLRHGGRLDYGTDMGNGAYRGRTATGPRPEEIIALGQVGLHGEALLASLTGPPADRLLLDRAIYAPLPLPGSADDVAVWMDQAQRLTGALPEAAIA